MKMLSFFVSTTNESENDETMERWNENEKVAVKPEENNEFQKAIQFFGFSYIFWNDILMDYILLFIGFKNSFCVSKSCK